MRGRLSIPVIVVLLLSFTVVGISAVYTVDEKGFLALDPQTIEVEKDSETLACPDWPFFDVNVTVSNVTDLSGVVVSVHWNASLLNCTMLDGVTEGFAPGDFLPEGLPDATGYMIIWDFAAGNMSEAANSMLSGEILRTVPEGEWSWVMTLTFEYVGPSPAIGEQIETDVIIVNQPDYAMATCWCESWGAYHDFEPYPEPVPEKPWIVSTSHFKYVGAGVPEVYPPECRFTIVTLPPFYVCTNVTFDASDSKPGNDGDDICPITEYRWDFGDGTELFNTSDPITEHHYNESGDFTVNLTVYAPGKPPLINCTYVNTDTCSLPISIIKPDHTYIDVYTENERWGAGNTIITPFNGTGPDVEADAYTPQENVTLFAKVVYNDDIVQNKPVAFEVMGPENPWHQIFIVRTAYTDSNGIATISFTIPWPCEHAEETVFGTWNVCATVDIAEVLYKDTLTFKVGWIIELISVISVDETYTPKETFKKGECVGVKITLKNIAIGNRSALITLVVYDDVGTPIARYAVFMTIQPGTHPIQLYCYLPVPKWAYVGPHGMVYTNAYTKWPEDGGVPYCPEVSHAIEIAKA